MSGRDPLTDRQRQVLRFITRFIRCHGFAPSFREIAGHLGVTSVNGVDDHLIALEKKGYIRRDRNVARSIRVMP